MDELAIADVGRRLVEELRKVIPKKRDKGWRYPAELKARVVSYARVCREQGETIDDIASQLGLVGATLARWLRMDRGGLSSGFRSVAIVPAQEGVAIEGRPIRLVSPRGYSVEGLDVQELAYLLQVIG